MAGRNTRHNHRQILGLPVSAADCDAVVRQVIDWAHGGESRYVLLTTVYTVMLAYDSAEFREAANAADLATADGMPLVWGLRRLGVKKATQVAGPDLMPLLLKAAADHGVPVGFYGGRPEVLETLVERVRQRFAGLKVAYAWSPPFRPLTEEEDREAVRRIRASNARILFVGLGTPKQDLWIAAHRGAIPAVMLGVGQAFDLLAGARRRAPAWMTRSGLEWLFRLLCEPRRLAERYLRHNPRFLFYFTLQLLGRHEPLMEPRQVRRAPGAGNVPELKPPSPAAE
ncbi:MAG: WecB/TagA/CpsF family glycosyltransferase [Bryobacterales bacterium]|nr:WecB/TagA/CpsF family glycosyltransferase [Bryobacterales bacterium]